MKIVSILNQKGGAGKTTIAVNLAHALQETGKEVLLVDSDTQASARDWHQVNEANLLQVIGLDRKTLDKDINNIKKTKGVDFIVIDGAPKIEEMSTAAIMCSDIVLIPVQPSPYDIWATEQLIRTIKNRQTINNGSPKAAFIISRQINNTKLSKDIRDVLLSYELPVFENYTSQRVIYAQSVAAGKTALMTEGEAAKEVRAIAKELMEFAQ
jgi:chromosome partitioning protein